MKWILIVLIFCQISVYSQYNQSEKFKIDTIGNLKLNFKKEIYDILLKNIDTSKNCINYLLLSNDDSLICFSLKIIQLDSTMDYLIDLIKNLDKGARYTVINGIIVYIVFQLETQFSRDLINNTTGAGVFFCIIENSYYNYDVYDCRRRKVKVTDYNKLNCH